MFRRRFALGDSWRPVPSPDQAREGAEHGRSAPAAGHGSPVRPARDEGRKGRNVRSPSKSKAEHPWRSTTNPICGETSESCHYST